MEFQEQQYIMVLKWMHFLFIIHVGTRKSIEDESKLTCDKQLLCILLFHSTNVLLSLPCSRDLQITGDQRIHEVFKLGSHEVLLADS